MIIVTGGTGLLGGHLLARLAGTGKPVRLIVRKGTDPARLRDVWKHYGEEQHGLPEQFEWFEADLTNKVEVYEAFAGASQVYHCAGLVSFSNRNRKQLWETNIEITGNIVNALLEEPACKLVHVSSVAAIRSADHNEVCTEQSGWPVSRESMYAATKTRGEMEVWRGICEGLNAVIVNPSIIIGPGNWKKSSAMIFDAIYKGLAYYTRGVTGYVDVRDVVECMIQLMQSDISGERFILNAANLSFQDMFNKVASALNVEAPSCYASPFITSIASRVEWMKTVFTGGEPRITRSTAHSSHTIQLYSAEKIRKALNFTFRDIDDTIRYTAECYLKEHTHLTS